MGSGSMDLGGGEGHWAASHEAVDEETGVHPAVVSIGLLGNRVLGAAMEGPGALVGAVEGSEVFVEEELETLLRVFPAEFADGVVRDLGVKVCDGIGCKVDGEARPMVAILVNGKEEFAVTEGRTLGELVSPPCEPSFDKME